MENKFEIIERYINDELTKSELKVFEDQISNNPELEKEIRLHKEIDNFLYDKETNELREQLQAIHKKTVKKQNSEIVFQRKRRIFAAAAVLLFLIGFGGIILLVTKPLTKKEIYKKYSQAYDISMINRSDSTGILEEAMSKYQMKEYEQALKLFDKAIEKEVDISSWVNLCIGISYTETDNCEKAVFYFNKIIESMDPLYTQQAQWYLGLSYLKANKTAKAEEIFKKISADKTHYKNEQASTIVEQL
jgi:tetratricopeptide (TPR) repeat protein